MVATFGRRARRGGRPLERYRVLRVWVKATPQKTQATRVAFCLFAGVANGRRADRRSDRHRRRYHAAPFVGGAGYAVAQMNRAPLALDVRDLWPATAVRLSQMSGGVPLAPSRVARALRLLARAESRGRDPAVLRTRAAIRGGNGAPPAHIPNATLERFFCAGRRDCEGTGSIPIAT
jgi:hypothetical protein